MSQIYCSDSKNFDFEGKSALEKIIVILDRKNNIACSCTYKFVIEMSLMNNNKIQLSTRKRTKRKNNLA